MRLHVVPVCDLYVFWKNEDLILKALSWLIESGYKWFDIPDKPNSDLMNQFLNYRLPDAVPGVEGIKMLNTYMDYSLCWLQIYAVYPGCTKTMIRGLDCAKNLDKDYGKLFEVIE